MPDAPHTSSTGPVGSANRVHAMDVLRGVALLGVFLANFVTLLAPGVMSTEEQLASLPTAAIDEVVHVLMLVFVNDKANTLFAFLFGLGFYLQMQRLEARRVDFERIYTRRLTVLLVFGILHLLLLWYGDILHLYALAGFALLALRNVSDRTLIVGGLVLGTVGRLVEEMLLDYAGVQGVDEMGSMEDAAVLLREQLSAAGNYPELVRIFAHYTWTEYVVVGSIAAWFLYALGRFMLGTWVGRRGWLQDSQRYLQGFRRVLRWALPCGLLLEAAATIIEVYFDIGLLPMPEWVLWSAIDEVLHFTAVFVLAAGYLCAVVVGLHGAARPWLTPFAAVGRMALTNYVLQSVVMGLVVFGVGPGLALAGHMGATAAVLIVMGVFALQMLLSAWWLRRFSQGPLEWVWRRLTYGSA